MRSMTRIILVLVGFVFWLPNAAASFFDGEIAYEAGNYQKAFEEWRAAAGRGDAPSMNALASLYEEGKGTAGDPILAYVYYDLAQVLGLGEAGAGRSRVAQKLSPTDLAEAKRISAGVKKTGSLPEATRKEAAAVEPTQSTQTTQPEPEPEPAEVETEVAANTSAPVGTPQLEVAYSCDLRPTWNDKGSGGARDVSLFEPSAVKGYSIIGGYAQGNYERPYGCVAVVRATNENLLAAPVRWKRVWADKGSGAHLDGSIWEAVAPSPDYVCLGALGMKGHNPPNIRNYACVHRCLVREVGAGNPVWTDEQTGAKSKVSIFALPSSNALVAFPSRSGPKRLRDLDPAAACVFQ